MDNELISISISMATYNGEWFLREQPDSIFAQTYQNLAVIVIDDCFTDSTALILQEYSEKYPLSAVPLHMMGYPFKLDVILF